MKSLLMKPHVFLTLCILSGLLVYFLPIGTIEIINLDSYGNPFNPFAESINIWDLYKNWEHELWPQVKVSFALGETQKTWELLADGAKSWMYIAPFVVLILLISIWSYLSRGSRYRVGFLLIASILIYFISWSLFSPPRVVEFGVTEKVINEVKYNFVTLLLMCSNVLAGIGFFLYYIFHERELDKESAS